MTTEHATHYSLNLSPRYVPEWSSWEAAREIVCNAFDACGEKVKITYPNPDEMIVETSTIPNIAEMLIMGEGSKRAGGNTIGQFGEGLKLAALVATRNPGGSLVLQTSTQTITFSLVDTLGTPVLTATIIEGKHPAGFRCYLRMPNIQRSLVGRILDDRTERPLEKTSMEGLAIYSKGVFVKILQGVSEHLWDWNLDHLRINRDRSMVDSSNLLTNIANYFNKSITEDQARQLIQNPTCFEMGYWCLSYCTSNFFDALKLAAYELYKDKVVIASESGEKNTVATALGYTILNIDGLSRERFCSYTQIKTVDQIVAQDFDLEDHITNPAPYQATLNVLASLHDVIGAPEVTVRIFKNFRESLKGRTVLAEHRIWLNEVLFTRDNRQELVRTYLHELAHIISGSGDATVLFEHALDGIAGRLALELIGKDL